MNKRKNLGATPGPSRSRKVDSSTWDRVGISDDGTKRLKPLYILQIVRLIDDSPLTSDERAAFKILVAAYANPNGALFDERPLAWPSEETLARRTGVGRTKLSMKTLPGLEQMGYIERCYRTVEGELTSEQRGRGGRWNNRGYVLHLDALERIEKMSNEERVEFQKVTLAKRKVEKPRRSAPRPRCEHAPCSKSIGHPVYGAITVEVHGENTDGVHIANTKGITPEKNLPERDLAIVGSGDRATPPSCADDRRAVASIPNDGKFGPSPEAASEQRERSDNDREDSEEPSGRRVTHVRHGSATAGFVNGVPAQNSVVEREQNLSPAPNGTQPLMFRADEDRKVTVTCKEPGCTNARKVWPQNAEQADYCPQLHKPLHRKAQQQMRAIAIRQRR